MREPASISAGGQSFPYDAFISYRRLDGTRTALWLRRELESFRLPAALQEGRRAKLRVYLDTAYERGTSDFFANSIRPALLGSRHLIVLATPGAVQRKAGTTDWIAREISEFLAGPRGDGVLVARAAGAFDGPLPGDLSERFANMEIVDLRDVGRFWFLNPAHASRIADEKLKLIAPLYDIPPEQMPLLRREEERRQQHRIGLLAGSSIAVLVLVASLSAMALRASWQARNALEEGMFVAGQMVTSIARSMKTSAAPDNARSNLLNQGCDLIDLLQRNQLTQAQATAEQKIACLVERAAKHLEFGEEQAAATALESLAGVIAAEPTGPAREKARSAALQMLYAQTDIPSDLANDAQGARTLSRLAKTAEAGLATVGDDMRLRLHAAEANGRLYDVLLADSSTQRDALAPLRRARDHLDRVVPAAGAENRIELRLWRDRLLRLEASLLRQLGDRKDALEIAQKSAVLNAESLALSPDSARTLIESAHTQAVLAGIGADIGISDIQRRAVVAAREMLSRLKRPFDDETRRKVEAVQRQLPPSASE